MGNKTKKTNYSSHNLHVIFFVLFPSPSVPSLNFITLKIAYLIHFQL